VKISFLPSKNYFKPPIMHALKYFNQETSLDWIGRFKEISENKTFSALENFFETLFSHKRHIITLEFLKIFDFFQVEVVIDIDNNNSS